MTAVVALGGTALMRPGERGTAAEQRANLREACAALRPLLEERQLVVTHGNGPQVGNELLRHERAADEAPPLSASASAAGDVISASCPVARTKCTLDSTFGRIEPAASPGSSASASSADSRRSSSWLSVPNPR